MPKSDFPSMGPGTFISPTPLFVKIFMQTSCDTSSIFSDGDDSLVQISHK